MKLRFAMGLLAASAIAHPALASDTTPEQIVVPAPPPGKAEVVFFRQAGFVGSAISCAPQDNGVKVGSLPPGRFAILVTEPGHHTLSGGGNVTDGVVLNLKPDTISYVSCTIKVGFWAGQPVFTVAHEEDFSTKLWKSVEKSRLGPNALNDDQIKAALAAQAAPATAAATPPTTPAPASTPAAAPAAQPVVSAAAPAAAAPATH